MDNASIIKIYFLFGQIQAIYSSTKYPMSENDILKNHTLAWTLSQVSFVAHP